MQLRPLSPAAAAAAAPSAWHISNRGGAQRMSGSGSRGLTPRVMNGEEWAVVVVAAAAAWTGVMPWTLAEALPAP